ncbi:Rrf2 family transcriptional regulator [Neisseria elongata]
MYLTHQTDYALRVLTYAAANSEGLVNIATIAEVYGISRSHLMKVATALVKGGFLDSVRGKGGGLRLSRPEEEIVIGDVVRHMEPMKLVECMGADNRCLLTSCCRLSSILNEAGQAFLAHLDKFTLSDLINQPTLDMLYTPKISLYVETA